MSIQSLLIVCSSLGWKYLYNMLINILCITSIFKTSSIYWASLTVILYKNSCITLHTCIALARCIRWNSPKLVYINSTIWGILLMNVLMSFPWKELNALIHLHIDTQHFPLDVLDYLVELVYLFNWLTMHKAEEI